MANDLGTEVVRLQRPGIPAGTAADRFRPRSRGCITACRSALNRWHACRWRWPTRSTRRSADEIHFAVKHDVQIVVADPAEIEKAIDRLYGQDENESFSEILKELGADKDIAREVGRGRRDGRRAADGRPGQRGADRQVRQPGPAQAVQDRASDIHFEPFEDEFRIRYRVDGALYEMAPPPKHLALPVISRLKVMAEPEHLRTPPAAGRAHQPSTSAAAD